MAILIHIHVDQKVRQVFEIIIIIMTSALCQILKLFTSMTVYTVESQIHWGQESCPLLKGCPYLRGCSKHYSDCDVIRILWGSCAVIKCKPTNIKDKKMLWQFAKTIS